MTISVTEGATTTLRTVDTAAVSVIVTATLQSDGEGITPFVLAGEADVLTIAAADTWNAYTFTASGGEAVTLELLSGAATISGNSVSRSSADHAVIGVTVAGVSGQSVYPLSFAVKSGTEFASFASFVSGSISLNLTEFVTALLVEGKELDYFSTISHTGGGTYTRNPDCWLAGKDLAAVAVASEIGGTWTTQHAGTLIAGQYAEQAAHFPTAVGEKMRWAKADGTVVERTVIGAAEYFDIRVIALSSATTITPLPIVGSWFAPTISSVTAGDFGGVPQSIETFYSGGLAAFIQQNKRCGLITLGTNQAFVSRASALSPVINGTGFTNVRGTVNFGAFPFSPYCDGKENFVIAPISGDSGSPCIVFPDGSPALYSHFHYTSGGPHLREDVLNALIAAARLDAIARGTGTPALQTVTVATDPTL
jgi:hypothetical protein